MWKRILGSIHIPVYNRFIAMEHQVDKIMGKLNERGIKPIVDYAIEKAGANPEKVVDKVKTQVVKYPNEIHALKLSVLGLNNIEDCYNNCIKIGGFSPDARLLVDAEQDALQSGINQISDKMILNFNGNKPIFFKTYQI